MQVSRLHLVTHTGILSPMPSTGPSGPASASIRCSSTAQVYEHRHLVVLSLLSPLRHLADSSLLSLRLAFAPLRFSLVGIRGDVLPSSSPQNHAVHTPEPEASVVCFSPGHLRRTITRPVSYYALFECVAASKPTSWLSMQLHILFHLTHTLGP